MTEQEAKEKWCPFARVAFGWNEAFRDSEQAVAATVNRCGEGHALSASTQCIGSACMAWRWNKEPIPAGTDMIERTDRHARGDTFVIKAAAHDIPGEGYCGLAGKP